MFTHPIFRRLRYKQFLKTIRVSECRFEISQRSVDVKILLYYRNIVDEDLLICKKRRVAIMLKHVLIVIDDIAICKAIKYNLQDIYTNVYYAINKKDGFKRYLEREYCLAIVEVDCRNSRLLEMLSYLREVKPIPILVYSLINTMKDKTICLDLGADAWIAAPFHLEECLSTANALVRRYTELNIGRQRHHVIFRNGLTLDLEKMAVWRYGRPVQLTVKEFQLLYYLASNSGQVINKEQIYYQLWKEDISTESNSVETLIMRLRKKLEQDTSNPVFIETIRGGGYRFKSESKKC